MTTRTIAKPPLLIVVAMMLSACVGRHQALDVAETLQDSTDEARAAVQAIGDVQAAQTKALQSSIDTLETVAMDTRKAIVDRAQAELDAAYSDAKLSIWKAYYEQVGSSYRMGWDLLGSMDSKLTDALSPLSDKIQEANQDAEAAAKEARVSQSVDKKLDAAAKAANVFGATSEYNRIEAQALIDVASQVQLETIKHLQDLADIRDTHLTTLEQKYKSYRTSFGQTLEPVSLPDAPDTSASLKDIENYLLAVKAAGGQIESYLETNTFSFMATKVVKSFAGGVVDSAKEALTNAGKLKTEVTKDDLVGDLKDLKGTLLAEVKADIQDARDSVVTELKAGASEAFNSVVTGFKTKAKEAVTGFADNLMNGAKCKISGALGGTMFEGLASRIAPSCGN